MKITDVETIQFTLPEAEHDSKWLRLRESRGIMGGFQLRKKKGDTVAALTLIHTDEGVTGCAPGGNPDTVNRLKGVLAGEDPLCRERLWHLLLEHTKTDQVTHGVIDNALWDLLGRLTGLPVHKLLGGGRDAVPAYASSLSDVGTIEEWCEHAVACKARGYRGYKIHPYFCMNPETLEVHPDRRSYSDYDIALCREIRAAVGDDFPLMLDPHGNYRSVEEALKVGRAIERLNFHWYEVPISEDNTEDYALLRRQLEIPVVGPEWSHGSYYTRAKWIRDRATDISRIDVHHRGITACIKAMHMAEANGMRCEIHRGGWDNIQLVAAVTEKTTEYYERFAPDPDTDRPNAPWVKGGANCEPMDPQGMVAAPAGPGLGFEVDWDYVNARRIDDGQRA